MNREFQMLREVSRTFALSIERLPPLPREALTLAYLLLRVSDGLEDHPLLGAEQKIALLLAWDDVLAGHGDVRAFAAQVEAGVPRNPEIEVALHAPELMRLVAALSPAMREPILLRVGETTRGMARWQAHPPRVADEAELDDYMHQVAGLVGYLITDVFSAYSPAVRAQRDALLPLGREFGLGLQTVNVIRGLGADAERDWIFVPRTFCAAEGLEPHQLFDPRHRVAALRVVGRLADKAERHLAHATQYIRLLPRREHRLRMMCAWPMLFAAATLAASRDNPEVLSAEVKIGRASVRRIMRVSSWIGWSNHALGWYHRRVGTATPIARPTLVGAA